MKKIYFLFFFIACFVTVRAEHITGGQIYYVLVSQSGNDYTYRITLKLYRDCFSTGAQLDNSVPIAIFNNSTGAMLQSQNVPKINQVKEQVTNPDPCIQNPPPVCYDVGFYEFTTTVPASPSGYTISFQRCCRIAGINNLVGSNSVGATYTAQIPGTATLATAPVNSSAKFVGIDAVVTCANYNFCYDFSAMDPDGDSLVYYFSYAYTGGGQAQSPPGGPNTPTPNPPLGPPYSSVFYNSSFSEMQPLGSGVSLNSKTGMMCGKAPAAGIYVVTVSVDEWRNGVRIATQRKDLQIKMGDCNLAASVPIALDISGAIVDPEKASCKSYTFNFKNNIPPNPLIQAYLWDFGDGGTSTDATPTHTYSDTGTYVIKLTINPGQACGGTSSTTLSIYPGFFPDFTSSGICFNKPTQFTDLTTATFGTVNSWKWDFGKANVINDTSRLRHPTYSFNQPGTYDVKLIVSTTKNCIDTVFKKITIIDKPAIALAFRDTLICRGDTLQLQASGNGNFSWSPTAGMTNSNSPTPTVSPLATSKYFVQLDDNGCINTDSVQVNVISFVTLDVMDDTTICRTDPIQLRANTDGLKFSWTPATGLSNANILNPLVQPLTTTTFRLTSSVGRCSAIDSVNIKVVPYPTANAGPDQQICFTSSAQLSGSINGSKFTWSPTGSLSNPNSLNPMATPAATTAYVLSAFDILGCPKPGKDTVLINVLPPIDAFAGKDTSIVVGQPLQFNASGGSFYSWSPSTGLSADNIKNPVGLYDGSVDSVRYAVTVGNENGCSEIAFVTVKIFKTNPQIFVPSAFTPNGDGKNDRLRPIPVGITKINYFRVYNRWGQIVFNTKDGRSEGWDGKIGGKEQSTGTYVWVAQGIDFTGKTVFIKGTSTLIR